MHFFKLFTFSLLLSFCANAQKVEIVFCADLSGSTNGMIVSLQNTIWSVVNEMDAKESIEEVKFGFVGYGRKAFGKDNSYSKVLHDLSPDINKIGYTLLKSQVLIQGCDAYPQKALNDCIEKISWSKEENIEKIVILIGNGGIPKKQMEKQLKKALKVKIKITPVYYKSRVRPGEEVQWKNFSKQCGKELQVVVPVKNNIVFTKTYDPEFLQSSGTKLLETYIPYGEEGVKKQKKHKFLFEKMKETNTDNYEEMLVYQSSYHVQGSNKNWDLVDLAMTTTVDYSKIDKEKLPLYLQGFTTTQLEKYIGLKVRERKLIIQKIRLELNKRQAFIKRKQIKSEHLVGKGGLSNVLQLYLNSEFDQMQLTSNASTN